MKRNKNKTTVPAVAQTDYKTEQLQRLAARLIMILESEQINETVKEAVFVVAEQAVFNADETANPR